MRKIFLGIILGIMVIGCSNREIKEYRGTYTYGPEIRVFQDENTKVEYWLYGESKKIEELNNHMEEVMKKEKLPYPKVQIEISGIDRGEATNGFAEPGDRKIELLDYKIIEN